MKTRKILTIVVMAVGVVGSAFGQLPAGWHQADFGDYSEPGTVLYDGASGKWIISTSCDWGGIFDHTTGCSHYVYTFLNGDGQITARIHSTDSSAFLEIRESLDDSTNLAGVSIVNFGPPSSVLYAEFYTGTPTLPKRDPRPDDIRILGLPYWIRVERRGDTFTWDQIGSTTISMVTETLYIGLGLHGSHPDERNTAEFDNVEVESGTGGWTIEGDNMYSAVSGNVGIGTIDPRFGLDIEVPRYTQAKLGSSFPIYFVTTGHPIIGFNTYTIGSAWQLGKGSTNHYGGIIGLNPEKGAFYLGITSEKGESGLDARPFTPGMSITKDGDVGIGTENPQGKLDVNGSIYQRGNRLHADYVFEPGYRLETIDEHSRFMWESKHLKAIPKGKIDANGQEIVEVGAHRRGIVEELEKAHIYIEQLHKRITILEEKLAKLEAGMNTE